MYPTIWVVGRFILPYVGSCSIHGPYSQSLARLKSLEIPDTWLRLLTTPHRSISSAPKRLLVGDSRPLRPDPPPLRRLRHFALSGSRTIIPALSFGFFVSPIKVSCRAPSPSPRDTSQNRPMMRHRAEVKDATATLPASSVRDRTLEYRTLEY